MAASFCQRCGAPLGARQAFGRERSACTECDYVHFEDPKVAVGVVSARDGRLLLVKRNHEPKLGEWSFPSGYMDAGEVLEEGAAREVKEETGLDVRIDRLIGAYSDAGRRVIFLPYAATIVGGELAVGPECQAVEFFDLDALPGLAFDHDDEVIAAWRSGV